MIKSGSYATCMPFLHCTDFPSIAVVRCKMRGLFVVMLQIATFVSQGKAQLSCKLWGPLLLQRDCVEQSTSVWPERNKHPYTQEIAMSSPPLHTHTHTHTHTTCSWPSVSSQPVWRRHTIVVCLTASVLTRPQVPPFTVSIELDITAEDLPWWSAEFGNVCQPS